MLILGVREGCVYAVVRVQSLTIFLYDWGWQTSAVYIYLLTFLEGASSFSDIHSAAL